MDTRSVIGCVVEPEFDDGNGRQGGLKGLLGKFRKEGAKPHKAKSLIVSMACTYEDCFLFAGGNVDSPFGQIWFGGEGEGDFADPHDLTVIRGRMEEVETTQRQQERTARVKEQLSTWGVPEFKQHIRWMLDDDDFDVHTPQEVARRVLAMHAVVCFARGRDHAECLEELSAAGVEADLTPNEREFFFGQPEDDEREAMIWNLEYLWQMMWALGHVEDDSYPNEMCDAQGLHELIFEKSKKDPQDFINNARLVEKSTLLDRLEFLIRVHWAARDAMINGDSMPDNLNWNEPREMVPVTPAMGVVAERHKAMNWICGFQNASWDDADAPT